jgi:hypothetical protein
VMKIRPEEPQGRQLIQERLADAVMGFGIIEDAIRQCFWASEKAKSATARTHMRHADA